MTLQEADKYMRTGETVYYVGGFMFQYHVFSAQITGISVCTIGSVPEVDVENLEIGKVERISINAVYTNESECEEKRKKIQKEMGYVIIKQKEYDELIALKNSMRDEAHEH